MEKYKLVGAIIVTHGNLASELLKSAEMILGRQENVMTVGIKLNDSEEVIVEKINKSINEVDSENGILFFTDMFGGTPSNLSLSFMEDNKVEVITGVNLPMLIKFFSERKDKSLDELVFFCKTYGKRHIMVASEILNQKKENKKK